MTDRELMEMAIDALEQPSPIGGFDNQAYVAKALRNRLVQPEWVGLTHEERDEIDQSCRSQMQAIFSTEEKLKEKNT